MTPRVDPAPFERLASGRRGMPIVVAVGGDPERLVPALRKLHADTPSARGVPPVIARRDRKVIVAYDAWSLPSSVLLALPARLELVLAEAGATSWRTLRASSRLALRLAEIGPVLVLRLFPPLRPRDRTAAPARVAPEGWIANAAEWLAGLPTATPMATLSTAEFAIHTQQERQCLDQLRTAAMPGAVVHESGQDIAVVHIQSAFVGGNMAVCRTVSDADLDETFERLVELARSAAPEADYAAISLEESLGRVFLAQGFGPLAWDPPYPYEQFIDQLVPDAFPYQVLTPRHMSRLKPEHRDRLAVIDGDRAELCIGSIADWQGESATEQRTYGWSILEPCLATRQRVDELEGRTR